MKNENCKLKNGKDKASTNGRVMHGDISERLLDFGAGVIHLVGGLRRTFVGRHIGGQLVRCSTSAGANYEEACGAESRPDFIHKLQVVLKELRESIYWLRLTRRSGLLDASASDPLLGEATELAKIIGKSIVTARANS